MFLRSLEIKNYRSLEHVELDHLGQFNVLIGRNNAGKSSVFGALMLLSNWMNNTQIDWLSVLTGHDMTRSFVVRLLFDIQPAERRHLIALAAAARSEERRTEILESPFLRHIEYEFSKDPNDPSLYPRRIGIRGEDGKWALIFSPIERGGDPPSLAQVLLLKQAAENDPQMMGQSVLDVSSSPHTSSKRIDKHHFRLPSLAGEPATGRLFKLLYNYLDESFFFSSFRHSDPSLPVGENYHLARDGSNLAQVLNTLNNNKRSLFAGIESLLYAALPDAGVLQPAISGTDTQVSLYAREGGYSVRLHDMGGGVEQLLMVATVLLTTGSEGAIFLEEPESHLHAGAQRLLIERLYNSGKQIFITTHSPVFVNSSRPHSVYRVRHNQGRTSVTHLEDATLLSEALEDVGSRNSDVLLSDAVLFVEGTGDRRALTAWSEKLNLAIEERNITVVAMGGGDEAARGTRLRREVLEGISRKAPVPHLFVLDRDERGAAEVAKLIDSLGVRIHLLERREIENYLLHPRALLAAIRAKHRNDAVITEKVDATSEEEVTRLIDAAADGLYGTVLVKRIRAEIPGLKGGLLPRASVASLAAEAHADDLARRLREVIDANIAGHLNGLDLDEIVNSQRSALDVEWRVVERRVEIAPGEELVSAVFRHFGSEYNKSKDTERIAEQMEAAEVPDEMRILIKRITSLSWNGG